MRILILYLCLLTVVAFSVSEAMASPPSSSTETQPQLSPELSRLVSWLPRDSETLWVVQTPFRVPPEKERTNLKDSYSLEKGFQRWNWSELPESDALAGGQVNLLVHGARKFRTHEHIGVAHYEGCTILMFDPQAHSQVKKLFQAARAKSDKTTLCHGSQLLLFKIDVGSEGPEIVSRYLASPEDGVLIWGTDLRFMSTLLDRRRRSRTNNNAFANMSREWKTVDTTADIWAIRHYDLSNPKDGTLPNRMQRLGGAEDYCDKDPCGLTLSYSYRANKVLVRYVSSDPEAQHLRAAYWQEPPFGVKVRLLGNDVQEMEFTIEKESAKVQFFTCLIAFLGHLLNV